MDSGKESIVTKRVAFGEVASHAEDLRILGQQHNLAVMTFDYRGYGRSEGVPSEKGVLQDARAARKWLARRTGLAEQDIVLMGYSLGGGVMVDLAEKDGARGLVLISTFTSLPDVAAYHYPWLPLRSAMRNHFDSLSKIGSYRGPLLQIHGDVDRAVPYEMGLRLHAEHHGPKRFVIIHGGDHFVLQSDKYHRALDDFIGFLSSVRSLHETARSQVDARNSVGQFLLRSQPGAPTKIVDSELDAATWLRRSL